MIDPPIQPDPESSNDRKEETGPTPGNSNPTSEPVTPAADAGATAPASSSPVEAAGENTQAVSLAQAQAGGGSGPIRRDDGNEVQKLVEVIKHEIHKVIIGMDRSIEECLAAMLIDGHVLLEGFPGVAKTLLVKLISRTLDVDFKRIQFTPDLMPADVIGTNIFDQRNSTFSFHKGPVFTNLVLIDEINRAPAKTQAALFEVMEERQVTVEGHSYQLDYPFLVIATQNPIDQEGTYRLPEAQLDRFVFKIIVPYPSQEEEAEILNRFKSDFGQQVTKTVAAKANAKTLKTCQKVVEDIHIEPQMIEYITRITQATRNHESLYLGASPRASIALMKTSKAFAAMAGRNYVIPDDIQKACVPTLNHRILLAAAAEMEGYTSTDLIKGIIDEIEVPR